MQQVRRFRAGPSKRGKADDECVFLVETAWRFLGLDTSELNSNGYSYVTNPSDRDKIIKIDDMKCLLRSVAVGLLGEAFTGGPGDAENPTANEQVNTAR